MINYEVGESLYSIIPYLSMAWHEFAHLDTGIDPVRVGGILLDGELLDAHESIRRVYLLNEPAKLAKRHVLHFDIQDHFLDVRSRLRRDLFHDRYVLCQAALGHERFRKRQ
jgi:hypothetical protein